MVQGIRRTGIIVKLLLLALPIAAVASLDAATPTAVPVALTEPLTTPLMSVAREHRLLSDSGLLMLMGSGLLGLAAIVRRTSKG